MIQVQTTTHQQINRHRIKAITCVLPDALCSTRVAMLARQLGHVIRVEFGPTPAVVVSKDEEQTTQSR